MSEHESAAMWKLYARTEEAICVRSSYAKLSAALPKDVFLGEVIYIDYEQHAIPLGNLLGPYIFKRKSFEHERELRALIADLASGLTNPAETAPAAGVWRDVDLVALIDRIYVAPTAPEWFLETVQATLRQFGFAFPVVRSALDEAPLW
jgi:methionine synthase II (cobalamin-independent)